MTPQEFKAWFDGFTENVDKQPTQKQWARIKERVAEIDGKPVTERVYVDRYVNYPPVWYGYRPANYPGFITCNNTTGVSTSEVKLSSSNSVGLNNVVAVAWNSEDAMFSLGKHEAESYAI